jgi:O-antigen ligase
MQESMIMAVPGMLFGIASLSQLKIGYRVTIFILLCCILALLPSIVPERPLQRLGTINEEITSGNLNERTTFWKEGLHFWRQHPLLGIGGGAFENVSPSGRSMHNSFMAVLAELGLIGMALYGLIWMNAMYQAWDHPRWESWFWATLLVVLMIGNSALTMGHTKRSWLFFGLLTASWGASFVKGELEASTKEDPRYGPFTWLGASR